MTKKRILLVEDEEHIREAIKLNLELENYEVRCSVNGKTALEAFSNERFDLIILDIMLPIIDGLQVCERIRLENTEIPILFLTAKNTTEDKISGLKKGGDDYLVKPFNLEELLLRVANLLKRTSKTIHKLSEVSTYKIGNKLIDFNSYEITEGAKPLTTLSKKELLLLKLLIERKNEVVSRQYILESIWGFDVYPSTRTIDNFILAFRKHFEEDPKNPKHFHSVRGVGYKFTV